MLKPIQRLYDLSVTLLLWIYFIFGFVILFLIFCGAVFPFVGARELKYQRLYHLFFRGFFRLTCLLIPPLRLEIDDEVKEIRSAMVVCNHISYLDPLLLISQFEKQKTIVKSSFLKLPVFGWLIKQSGYVPSVGNGVSAWEVFERILHMGDYLSTGGNVFVFPEGTRSRDGTINQLSKGAFEIALRSRAPIKVLFVENSNLLFRPGRFLFNTAIDRPIRLKLLETLNPDYDNENFSIQDLMETVQSLFEAGHNEE